VWQGLVSIGVSIAVISWGTLARNLPDSLEWAQCNLDRIIVGAVGTAALIMVAVVFSLTNWRKRDTAKT
jgi:SSS family solute:Na+ symporter